MKAEFKKNMFKRIFIFAIAIAFLFSVDGARLFYLQLVNGSELSAKAESQQLSDTEIPAMRGTIYDSEGNVTASKDLNGVTTTYEYDANGNLIKEMVGTDTTSYTYTNGLLTKVEKNEESINYICKMLI